MQKPYIVQYIIIRFFLFWHMQNKIQYCSGYSLYYIFLHRLPGAVSLPYYPHPSNTSNYFKHDSKLNIFILNFVVFGFGCGFQRS